jgi:lipopolysaccharide transport system permease protein
MTSYQLPDEPLVTIQPSGPRAALDLRELWSYRELLFFLAWRDLKIRYKQTVLGIAWVVLQPLFLMLIFTVFLGKLARVPSESDVAYSLFVYVGLLPWTFFSSAVTSSGSSLVTSSYLITKVYFPRIIIPAAVTLARLVDFAIAFVMLVPLAIYYRVNITLNLAMLPVMILLTVLLALGVGTLVSALNVRYRDVSVILPVVVQFWMFVSPVFYPATLVPAKWHTLYALNPLFGIIDGFRATILGRPFDWTAISVCAGITIVLFVYSLYMFRRAEKIFADVI